MVDLHYIRTGQLMLLGPDIGDVHIVIDQLYPAQHRVAGHDPLSGFVLHLENSAAIILY